MEYRTLGTSDITVTPMTFGAWAIGGWRWGGTNKNAAIAAVRNAIDMGINSIDTAAVYGFGLSEEIDGEDKKTKMKKALRIVNMIHFYPGEGSRNLCTNKVGIIAWVIPQALHIHRRILKSSV